MAGYSRRFCCQSLFPVSMVTYIQIVHTKFYIANTKFYIAKHNSRHINDAGKPFLYIVNLIVN